MCIKMDGRREWFNILVNAASLIDGSSIKAFEERGIHRWNEKIDEGNSELVIHPRMMLVLFERSGNGKGGINNHPMHLQEEIVLASQGQVCLEKNPQRGL